MLKEIILHLDEDGKVHVSGLGHSVWESPEQGRALERLISLLEHAGHGPGHRVPEPGAKTLQGIWSDCLYCHPPLLKPMSSSAEQARSFSHRCGYQFIEQEGYPTTFGGRARYCPQCGLPVSLPKSMRLDERPGPRDRKTKRGLR